MAVELGAGVSFLEGILGSSGRETERKPQFLIFGPPKN